MNKYAGALLAQSNECRECNGEGWYFTGVEHTGMQETKTCYKCEGTGFTEKEGDKNEPNERTVSIEDIGN